MLDEIKSTGASVSTAGAGGGGNVTSGSTTLLTVQDPTGLTALPGTPTVTATIDATSDPGHIVFSYDRTTDTRTLATDGSGNTTGYTESTNDTTHIVHVYTPAYFAAHFTDPTQIALSFTPPPLSVSATATLLGGSLAGASVSASGSVGDAFMNYAYVISGN